MAENVDEEILAELERQRQEERRRQRQRVAAVGKQVIKSQIKKAVAKKVSKQAVAAGARAGLAALGSILAPAVPYILAGLAIIGAIIGIVFLVWTIIAAGCNESFLTRAGSKAASLVGIIPTDVCEKVAGLQGVVTALDQADLSGGPPPPGAACAADKPPLVDRPFCLDCVDARRDVSYTVIPVKVENTNSEMNKNLANRLLQLWQRNQSWRVTEAFCPTAYHASHDHYFGLAVDLNIRPELQEQWSETELKAALAQLYEDVKAVGFVGVICEYPAGYLTDYGISCAGKDTTKGAHLHIEERHDDSILSDYLKA